MTFAEALVACINGAKIRLPDWCTMPPQSFVSFDDVNSQFLGMGKHPYYFFDAVKDRTDWEILED